MKHDVLHGPATPTMTTLFVVFSACLGLVVGSFLNVVTFRVPRHESIVAPRSHCPHCDETLHWNDTIPLASWLYLRGRCRQCRTPISIRYPMLELATALLYAGVAASFGPGWNALVEMVFVSGLIALTVIDIERLLL